MSSTPVSGSPPDPAPPVAQEPPDPQAEELRRQVLADVREFGPRKYQAFYTKAKQLREDGLGPDFVRRDLVGEPPSAPSSPQGGLHLITRVNYEKKRAFYYVVRHAVEDALARRPPQFREEFGAAT